MATRSWNAGRLWETQPAVGNMPAGRTDVTPWDPGNQPKGFAWFGDAKGKGRWGIDTASDHWSAQDKSNFSYWDNQKQGTSKLDQIKRSLPGWFGFTGYNPETGAVRGYSRHSGGSGVITQGGDLTAEHYGQPGSWSVDWDKRPDGSYRNVVGDYWWEQKPGNKFTSEQHAAGYAKDTPYLSSDPNYQAELTEQKARMREKKVADLLAGKGSAVDLYSWDKQYGQEDLAGGKHGTQEFSELDSAVKQAQLAQQQQGVVRGGLETERADKGMTLAQRLRAFTNTGVNPFKTQSTQAAFTGMGKEGYEAISRGADFIPGNNPLQILGKGAYSAPTASGAARYAGTGSSLGLAQEAGGIIPTIAPKGSLNIPFIEPQSKVSGKTFDKGRELASDLLGGKYAKSATANRLRNQLASGSAEVAAKTGGKKLARAIPLVGTALGAWDVGSRLMQGDYKGAALGGVSMLPGPIGWAGLASQVGYDINKARGSTYNPNINRNVLTIRN